MVPKVLSGGCTACRNFVINKQGKIIYKHIGPILKKDLMVIENILSENQ